MNDIYGIKFFDFFWINYYFLIVFFIIIFFYIIFDLKKRKKKTIIEKIINIKNDNLTDKKIDYIFRKYFSCLWIKKTFSKTLKELKIDFSSKKYKINNELILLFEKNYNSQFSQNKTNKIQLDNILNKLKKIIKNEH